jgi:CRISPR-associated protein Cas1
MIKRTLYFGNPAYLKTKDEQLIFQSEETGELKTLPIEDIGVLIIDHQQITVTQALIAKLLANNVAFITCDNSHHPTGMLLNLDGNTLQSAKFQAQVEASVPLKKQLWQQTISCKINNQAALLESCRVPAKNMRNWSTAVKSGDSENHEAVAAVYYWKNIFQIFPEFKRERFGDPPNNLLNYGYAILRAITARSLVASGLLPTLGIFHKNQYNAYCLADDIMEPYRPFVDAIVRNIVDKTSSVETLTQELKVQLLKLPTVDVLLGDETSPLMIATQRTAASLARCYTGEQRKLLYPEMRMDN